MEEHKEKVLEALLAYHKLSEEEKIRFLEKEGFL